MSRMFGTVLVLALAVSLVQSQTGKSDSLCTIFYRLKNRFTFFSRFMHTLFIYVSNNLSHGLDIPIQVVLKS